MIAENEIFQVETCKKCPLNGKVRVPWEVNGKLPGDFNSLSEVPECHVVFVGEAPGHEEEKRGIPFIHKAGNLLRDTISKIRKENREFEVLNVMITNACKCKPEDASGNIRAPYVEEIACCRLNLKRDIELAKPLIIVALGRTAVTALEVPESGRKLEDLRGRIFETKYGKVLVTYHPSAILRQRLKNVKTFEADILNAFKYAYSQWLSRNNTDNTREESKKRKSVLSNGETRYIIDTRIIATSEDLIEEFKRLEEVLKPERKPLLRLTAFDYETVPLHWEHIPQFDKHLAAMSLSPHLGDVAYAGISYVETVKGNEMVVRSFSFPVRAKSYAKRLLEVVREKRTRLQNDLNSIAERIAELAEKYKRGEIHSTMLSLYFLYEEYGISEEEIEAKFTELVESGNNPVLIKAGVARHLKEYVRKYQVFETLVEKCLKELEEKFSVDEELAVNLLRKYLTTRHYLHVACNSQFEMAFTIKKLGIEFERGIRGTEILDYLLGHEEHSLEELEKRYLSELVMKGLIENYTGKSASKERAKKSVSDFVLYNAEDTAKTLVIYLQECKEIKKYEKVRLSNSYKKEVSVCQAIRSASEFISNVVMPAAIYFHLEGIKLDVEKCKVLAERAKNYIRRLTEKLNEIIPGVNSVRDDDFRFKFWKLYEGQPITTPKDGKPSLSESALKTAYQTTRNEDFKRAILYVHSIHKYEGLLSKYVEKYPFFVNPATGRIHPWYDTTRTASGRVACKKPNIQQVPREPFKSCPECFVVPIDGSEKCPVCGRELEVLIDFREVFVPEEGHFLAMADYSQIEMAILAELSGDEKLISAINDGLDMHSYNAANVYGIPYEEIVSKKETDENIKRLRQNAKKVTFAVIYGATDEGIAAREGISKEEAARIINTFFSMHPGTRKWIEERHREALNHHVVLVPTGRPRWFPETSDGAQINAIKRRAQNTPIQGFASDVNFVTCELLRRSGMKVIGAIHDSIIVEVPEEQKEEFEKKFSEMVEKTINLKDTLRDFFGLKNVSELVENLKVKLKAEARLGKSWKEVK